MLAKRFVQKFGYSAIFLNHDHPLNETQLTSVKREKFEYSVLGHKESKRGTFWAFRTSNL